MPLRLTSFFISVKSKLPVVKLQQLFKEKIIKRNNVHKL